jgi:calcineurin-like phosphoesterase
VRRLQFRHRHAEGRTLRRFITGMPKERFTPAAEEATLSGVVVETDDRTGAATRITPVRFGGRLQDAAP